MRMKKKDVMEFLDKVENKAVFAVKEKYYELIQNEKTQIAEESGLLAHISKLQKKINEIHRMQCDFMTKISEENESISYIVGNWNSLESHIDKWCGKEEVKRRILGNCPIQNNEIVRLKNVRDKEIEEVRKNYQIVKAVCKEKRNGVLAGEYLTSLGFDLSSLEKIKNEVIEKVDTSKLFVCGENK